MADCSCQNTPTTRGVTAAVVGPFAERYPTPEYPPSAWFTDRPDWLVTPDEAVTAHLAAGGDPNDLPLPKVQVDDEGRVAGYFYNAGQCLVHDPSACPKPSPTGYGAFHQSHVATADGQLLRVGVMGNVGGHADPYASVEDALAHYANPNLQLISCRAYDDDHGGYILGSLVPDATYGDVALIRRSPLSGDWRPMDKTWWDANGIQASVVRSCEGYDCIGPTLVTRPGLPLVVRYPRAAALGGLGGVQLSEEPRMGDTTIDLGNGVKVTTSGNPTFPPGPMPATVAAVLTDPPAPAPAVTAAEPPPGAGEPPAESEAESGVEQRVADLEAAVNQLQDAVGQLIDMVNAPMAETAALPEPLVLAE